MAVEALPRPGKGLSADAFYLHYLPELYAALHAALPAPSASVSFDVALDGADVYALSLGPAGLSVSKGRGAAPLATVATTTADWRTAVRDLLPRLLRFAEKDLPRVRRGLAAGEAALGRVALEAVRARPGRIDVALTDDSGDVQRCACAVGDGQGPCVSLRLGDAELWALLGARGVSLAAAVTSKVRIDGEVRYLVDLLAALGA